MEVGSDPTKPKERSVIEHFKLDGRLSPGTIHDMEQTIYQLNGSISEGGISNLYHSIEQDLISRGKAVPSEFTKDSLREYLGKARHL